MGIPRGETSDSNLIKLRAKGKRQEHVKHNRRGIKSGPTQGHEHLNRKTMNSRAGPSSERVLNMQLAGYMQLTESAAGACNYRAGHMCVHTMS